MVLMTDNIESFHRSVRRFQAAGVRQRLRQQRMLCIYLLIFQLVVVYLCIAESAWKVRRLRRTDNAHALVLKQPAQAAQPAQALKHQHAIVQQTASFNPCYGHLCA